MFIFIIIIIFIGILLYVLLKKNPVKKSKNIPKPVEPDKPVEPVENYIDSKTPKDATIKFNDKGMSLIYSNEMKDMERIKKEWLIADEPLGTLGISDNFSYVPDNVKLGTNGLELHMKPNNNWKDCFTNGTFNPDNNLLGKTFTSGKVTGVKGVRFKYGIIEAKIRCPSLQGIWPAFWLNFSSGTMGPKYPKGDPTQTPIGVEWKSVLTNYPFLNSNFWPPEIDILEITTNNFNTWQNQSSIHTPNQYNGDAQYYTWNQGKIEAPYRWCPTGIEDGIQEDGKFTYRTLPPDPSRGPTWTACFGVSKFAKFESPDGSNSKSTSHDWHVYRAEWYTDKVDFYLDEKFYGSITDRDLVPTYSGSMRSVVIPDVPMFPVINLALSQSWAQGGNNGINNPVNFKDKDVQNYNSFVTSPMEIAYIRIYQDKNGTGMNPDISDSIINITKNQIFGQEYALYYNTNQLIGGIKDKKDSSKIFDDIFINLNSYLQATFKDNYCLTVDAITLWNYGGSGFDKGLSDLGFEPNQIQRIKRLNSIIFYILTRYGVGVVINENGNITYNKTDLKLPDSILNTRFWKNFGTRSINIQAPCEGVQTLWGDRMDSLNCV